VSKTSHPFSYKEYLIENLTDFLDIKVAPICKIVTPYYVFILLNEIRIFINQLYIFRLDKIQHQ